MNIISLLWNSRKFICICTGVVTAIAIIIVLIVPESFKSSAVILPDADKSKLASLGGMSDLAALAGINIGGEGSFVKLYPTIIKSETVLKKVIYTKYQTKEYSDSVNLIQHWKIIEKTPERDYESALKALRGALDITMELKTNVITISLEESEPQLAADIVNNVTAGLDKFFRTKRSTSAGEQRKFIESRLNEIKQDLEISENILKEFREKNRSISGSPQLSLQLERLVRDVQINSTIYIELKKQYEIAKIEEVKNIPIVSVMDKAIPAANRISPKRTRTTIVTFILSLVCSMAYVYFSAKYKSRLVAYFRVLRSIMTK